MYKDSKNVKIIKIFQPEVGQLAFKVRRLRASEPADLQFWGTLFFDPSFFGLNQ